MIDDVIRQAILEFREVGLPSYVPRDADVPIMPNMVTTIVGGRKTGKTYLTYQGIEHCLGQKVIESLDRVCYLHFDDERLLEMQTADLRRVDSVFLELTGASSSTPLLFVFDEIHRVEDWEYFALRLSRVPNWHVIVTGSSANLEEDRVARQLRGKTFTVRLHPLSFREYLRFCGKEPASNDFSTVGAAHMSGLFRDYLTTGSYPAMHGIPAQHRRDVLRQYFSSIVASDFVDVRKVLHPLSCKLYLRNLLRGNACPYTHKAARNTLASMAHHMQPNTISDWFTWAEESYVVGVNTINSESVKKREQNYRKVYAVDWALANTVSAFAEPRTTRNLEACVYWHLKRLGLETSYALVGSGKHEVDFVAGQPGSKPSVAVQVCADLADPNTLERECRALDQLVSYYGSDMTPLIITMAPPPSGVDLRYPVQQAWRWCLDKQES